MTTERRKHYRFETTLRCWCQSDGVTLFAPVDNLSEGGLFLRTAIPLRGGTRAKVKFGAVPPFEAVANVQIAWIRPLGEDLPPGMGLCFEGLDDSTVKALRRIILAEQMALG